MTVFEASTSGPEQTRDLAGALSDVVVDGDLIVLTGDLGAGKTCFAQGLGLGLGIEDRMTSPTFTLANRYAGRLTLHHLDVYRLDGPDDAVDLDLDTLLEDGLTVIEWGDRLEPILPTNRLDVHLTFPDLDTDLDTALDTGAGIDVGPDLDREIGCTAVGDMARLLRFEGWPDRDLPTLLARWAA